MPSALTARPGAAIENLPCQRVMEMIGMQKEGTARDCIWAQGRWWTEVQYGMLEGDKRCG